MSENYYIDGHLLYKVSLPRGKKEQRARPQNYLLCIPKNHTTMKMGVYSFGLTENDGHEIDGPSVQA